MSTSSASGSTELTGDDLLAIRNLVRSAQNSQQDADALAELHTEESIVVNLAGRRVFGASDLALAMRTALRSTLHDVLTSVDIIDVRQLTADIAVVSCVKTVHDERAEVTDSEQLPVRGALTYVVRKKNSTWRIAVAQTTPISM